MPSGLGPTRKLLRETSRWFLPRKGWVTFALTLLTAISVVWSVENASWVDTPSLAPIVVWGIITGLVLAKVRLSALLLQPIALFAGTATVAVYGTRLIEGGSLNYRLGELYDRVGLWISAASSNGISTDPVPFGLGLVILSWLLGYLCGWFVFRRRSFWIPLLLTGSGILINLSYLPSGTFGFFFTYILLAVLLAAWINIQRREEHWTSGRISRSPYLAAANLHHAFWFSLLVIAISFLLPIRDGTIAPAKRIYEYATQPLEQFQGDFNRLFAGLPARKPLPYRTFDDSLPFQGRIRLSDDKIFSVRTSQPSYLRVRSYPTYTSKGWVAADTQFVPLDWEPAFTLPTVYTSTQEIRHQVNLDFRTITIMVPGAPADSDIRLRVEVPAAPTYTISLRGSPGGSSSTTAWPADVRDLARTLADRAARQPGSLTEAQVLGALPDELRIRELLTDDNGVVNAVTVERPLPVPLDILSVRSARRLFSDDTYTVSSIVSVATMEELRQAGEEYPAWVTDIYLQLPDSLPERVRALAQSMTARAETPYDRTVAIQDYLRSLPYTLDMPPVPFDGDGVDHLLFTVRAGYSDYFGSAMAVMLRAVGIPSRMVVGYTPGERQDDGSFVVRDRNSHGWTEAFFPGYGWILFEPTPSREPIVHGEETPDERDFGGGFGQGFFEEEKEEPFGGPFFPGGRVEGGGSASLVVLGIYVAIGLMVVGATSYLGFRWLLGPPATPVEAYAKMHRLTRLAGLGPYTGQTPREYGRHLSHHLGGQDSEIAGIVEGYEKACYGSREVSEGERESATRAWSAIRATLLARIFRRG